MKLDYGQLFEERSMTLNEELEKLINNHKLDISAYQIEKLIRYAEILKLSKRKSFASWDEDDKGLNIHFNDSFYTLPFKEFNGTFLDIGSGAGIPGIIYSILWRDSKACLLESQKQRIYFLKETIKTLSIDDRVEIIEGRAEEIAKDKCYREKFQLVTSRALASFVKFIEYSVAFVKKDGYLHAIRSIKDKENYENIKNILDVFSLSLNHERIYSIDNNKQLRWSSVFIKTSNTPLLYPRKNQLIGRF